MVNCDVVSWVSSAQKRELIKLFFIRRAGGRADNDVTFSNNFTMSFVYLLLVVIKDYESAFDAVTLIQIP